MRGKTPLNTIPHTVQNFSERPVPWQLARVARSTRMEGSTRKLQKKTVVEQHSIVKN